MFSLIMAQDAAAPKKEKMYDLDESIDLNELKNKLDLFRVTRDVVNAHIGALMAIHTKYKTQDPKNVGQMIVKIELTKEGAVDKCKVVKSDIKDGSFNDEVVASVKQWQFGNMPQAGQEVLVPFFFK
jgi:TonB family protein